MRAHRLFLWETLLRMVPREVAVAAHSIVLEVLGDRPWSSRNHVLVTTQIDTGQARDPNPRWQLVHRNQSSLGAIWPVDEELG